MRYQARPHDLFNAEEKKFWDRMKATFDTLRHWRDPSFSDFGEDDDEDGAGNPEGEDLSSDNDDEDEDDNMEDENDNEDDEGNTEEEGGDIKMEA
jgi:hypothetical protein